MNNPQSLNIPFRALLTMTGETIENGYLVVERGRVKEIRRGPVDSENAGVLDLSDCLLLPGFVNAHCHLGLSCLKGRVSLKKEFAEWVRELQTVNPSVSTEERVRKMRAGAEELLRSGVTTLADYLAPPELLQEFERLPFRQVLFLETLGFDGSDAQTLAEGVRSVLQEQPLKGERIRLGVAPHAPYSVSPALFKELKKLSHRFGSPFSCHVAEFPEEVRFLKEGGGEMRRFLEERGVYDKGWVPPGKSPVEYLDSLGVLDSMTAIHLNHVEGDLDLLASRNVRAVFCPNSTRWFERDQWMPVRDLLDRGIPVGLGTDSLASNDSLDFLEELRAAEKMLPDVSRQEILHMATAGGAHALGLDGGRIKPGQPADLIGFRVEKSPGDWADIPLEPQRKRVDFVIAKGEVIFPYP